MRVSWHFTQADVECVKMTIENQLNNPMVQNRKTRNLAAKKADVTKAEFWKALVCTRLTTQALITPTGRLAKFQKRSPFPLSYNTALQDRNRNDFIYRKLIENKVGTHPKVISKQLAENFEFLQGDGWQETRKHVNSLTTLQNRDVEARVANYLADNFKGFGPKQSRNVLQHLRLTRFEIPLDSRVMNWLNNTLKFPFRVSSVGLADKDVYRLVLDAICELCALCNAYPCVLDAAIFVSKGGNADEEY
jgi:ribosomal protein S17E